MSDNIQNYLQTYITENKDIYTQEVIQQKLLDAGYTYEDIYQAFNATGFKEPTGERSNTVSRSSHIPVSARGFLTFFLGAGISLIGLAALFPGTLFFSYIVIIIAGILMPRRARRTDPSLAKGYTYGFRAFLVIFLCLPFIAFIILVGLCFASLPTG